jgi:hypothetical protein
VLIRCRPLLIGTQSVFHNRTRRGLKRAALGSAEAKTSGLMLSTLTWGEHRAIEAATDGGYCAIGNSVIGCRETTDRRLAWRADLVKHVTDDRIGRRPNAAVHLAAIRERRLRAGWTFVSLMDTKNTFVRRDHAPWNCGLPRIQSK